jgi:extradiol dioxygenase family protein
MKLFKLDHIALTITNIEVAENFYSNILELTKIYRPGFITPGLWYNLGECSLHLILSTDNPNKKHVNKTTQPHFAIQMTNSDYFKQKTKLESLNIEIITEDFSKETSTKGV